MTFSTTSEEIDCNKLRKHLIEVHDVGDAVLLLNDKNALELHDKLHTHLHTEIRREIDPNTGARR